MSVLLPVQIRTCGVPYGHHAVCHLYMCLANVVCCDVHMARPRPQGKELARERNTTRKSEKVAQNYPRPAIPSHHIAWSSGLH
jgi:hypothetical protein